MTAEIYQFPTSQTCRRCVHFMAYDEDSANPGRCWMFDREVRDVHEAARDCNGFEHWEVTRGNSE